MSQFGGLFNATRIPMLNKDKIFSDHSCNHVVVQRNGNFYIFDVLDSDGKYFNNVFVKTYFLCFKKKKFMLKFYQVTRTIKVSLPFM